MKTTLIIICFILFTATAFVGGILTVVKSGEKEGICDYGYKEDNGTSNKGIKKKGL